jgi:DNA-binding GntR family transcriptional regulator
LGGPSPPTLVIDMLRGLRFQTRLFILNTMLYRSDLERDELTHRSILNAISAGDPVRAEACVHRHIIDAGRYLIRKMEPGKGVIADLHTKA